MQRFASGISQGSRTGFSLFDLTHSTFSFIVRRIVLVATQDEPANHMNSAGQNSLISLGGASAHEEMRSSYALIGYTGPGSASFASHVNVLFC